MKEKDLFKSRGLFMRSDRGKQKVYQLFLSLPANSCFKMQKVKGAALNIYSNGFVPAMALLPTLSSFSPPPSFPVMYWIFMWSFSSDLLLWKCCWCRVTSGVRHAGLHRGRGQQDGGGGAGGRAHLPRHAHRLLQGEQRLVQRMPIFD